ncbi:hypothetical protein ACHAQJ_002661 [Trichoderma viride]
MADMSSTSKVSGVVQEQFANMSASPSESSSSSPPPGMFEDSSDDANQEPHMAWPPSTLLAGQGFPFPLQQQAPDPLVTFTRLQEHYKQHFQMHHAHQAPPLHQGLPKYPEFNQYSSPARLVHEQRLSTNLNMLRHVQRTLRQRHDEAQLQHTRTSHLVQRTAWHLFFQSPLDYMCHEMDILTDPATINILAEGGAIPKGQSVGESEAWMKRLDALRDLQDDEYDAKKRVDKAVRQMKCADAMMVVGLKEQEAVLLRDNPMNGQYHMAFHHHPHGVQAIPSKSTTCATPSTFLNWPLSATPQSVDNGANNTDGNSSDSSQFEVRRGQACCQHHAQ